MVIFFNAADAGRLGIGDDARVILDAVPDYVIPADVSFVASDTQFTPKTVETEDERQKLMFRSPAQGRSTGFAKVLREGRDRVARLRIRAHKAGRQLAGPARSQASTRARFPAGRRSARSCFGGAALYAASRFLARYADAHDRSGFSARHAGADFAYSCCRFLARRSDTCASTNQ